MSRIYGWALLTVTFLLVVLGGGLYLLDQPGWAQMAWVFASGTAGGGIALLIGPHDDDWPHALGDDRDLGPP